MRILDKILEKLEACINNDVYVAVESEKVELKPTPPNLVESKTVLESINAFLNTEGGIVILGIQEDIKNKKYVFKGYKEDFEPNIKEFCKSFTDKDGNILDLGEYLKNIEIREFLDGRVCVIYVERLPDDLKYVFYKGVAYIRKITGDEIIPELKIIAHEEYKEEIRNSRELLPVKGASLQELDLEKINEYIQLLNREVKVETIKPDLEAAISFLTRKKFIVSDEITTLGMLVCGQHIKDFLGWRCQVDCFIDSEVDVAQDKKTIVDNVIPLMERSLSYVLKNIQIGVTYTAGGTSKPEYSEKLLRETINNALAHRDYSIDKYVNINIKPNQSIEIRNPGYFKKQLLIENSKHEIPIRRIIPDSKPLNPKLADILKIFDKWEGKARGMSNLVNESLNNNIDLPYYRFYSKEDLGLFLPKGKLVDETFEVLLNSYDGFIERLLEGDAELNSEEKAVLAYLYKSEKANSEYKHTIMLTPDNNHFNAIARLTKRNLIYKHPESPELYPVYIVNRQFMKEDYLSELRENFGSAFDALPQEFKNVLTEIYKYNNYNKKVTISANQTSYNLYLSRNKVVTNLRELDGFKRKVRNIFNKLEAGGFIYKKDKKKYQYLINSDYKLKPSLFD
ncbi:MAG TPA: putative DNA binding domain-containing protein [Bacteroidales bacterium]|nr:putative DNA binding domain-containing protein [Bacteroidales bacterium]